MVDAIIVLIVIVLLIFALKGTLKHFKGESPCCGGGSGLIKTEIEEKVLEHPAIGKKTVMVSGMHCDHCVKSNGSNRQNRRCICKGESQKRRSSCKL